MNMKVSNIDLDYDSKQKGKIRDPSKSARLDINRSQKQ